MTDLRICLITETYFPEMGGGETQARALVEGLAGGGHAVTVLTRRSRRELARRETGCGWTIERLAPAGRAHWKKWGLLLTLIPPLIRRRRAFDLVFVSGYRVVGLVVVPLARLLGKPVVLKADSLGEMSGAFFQAGLAKYGLSGGFWPVRLFLAWRNRVLRRAAAFVAISSAVREELRAGGVDGRMIAPIPNSVDTDRFLPVSAAERRELRRRFGLPESARIAIYTGRLVTTKGLPLLVEVWRRLAGEMGSVHLLLVGEGGLGIQNCEAALRASVRQHGLDGRVTFTGRVTDVAPYLQAADCFVLPSEDEAFGLAAVEAMACGLPVLATAVGGLVDIVGDGETGLLIPPADAGALAGGLRRLLGDEKLSQALGRAGRRRAEAVYSQARILANFEQLFGALIDGRGIPDLDPAAGQTDHHERFAGR